MRSSNPARIGLAAAMLLLAACARDLSAGPDAGGAPDGAADSSPSSGQDAGIPDWAADSSAVDSSTADSSVADSSSDAAGASDALVDGSGPADSASPSDTGAPLLGPPCTHGTGFVAWSFHYDGSTSAITDVYSLPDSNNWQVAPAYSTSFVDSLHGGGIEIASGNWLLIRFSVVGLSVIQGATLSVYGRSYDTTASGSFDGWSPLYGDVIAPTDSVSNAWPYAWTSVDYSQNVQVGDSPGLTGLRLYAGPSSSDLVVHTVELCIDGH